MFFDNLQKIEEISKKNGTTIFVVPDNVEVKIKNALMLKPEKKATITIDQVRDVLASLTAKQTEDRFVLIRPADKMGEEAENAILKNLEEPSDRVHFVLVTSQLAKLLPTIVSRAMVFVFRDGQKLLNEIAADKKVKDMAKRLLTAKSSELVPIAEDLTKKKDGVRESVLEVIAVAIEMAYKSYFLTNNSNFLKKIPKLILAYDNIALNGHIKLHLVADLI